MVTFESPQKFILHWKYLQSELAEVLLLRGDAITNSIEEELRIKFLEACTPAM
jgi:hypothetical protein